MKIWRWLEIGRAAQGGRAEDELMIADLIERCTLLANACKVHGIARTVDGGMTTVRATQKDSRATPSFSKRGSWQSLIAWGR
jgi:hypothetical protein